MMQAWADYLDQLRASAGLAPAELNFEFRTEAGPQHASAEAQA